MQKRRDKPPSAREVLGTNLFNLRRKRKLSQKELGKLVKPEAIPQRTVGRIEQGKHSTQIDNIEGLARVHGLSAWQLLVPGLDPEKPPVLAVTTAQREDLARAVKVARSLADTGEWAMPPQDKP